MGNLANKYAVKKLYLFIACCSMIAVGSVGAFDSLNHVDISKYIGNFDRRFMAASFGGQVNELLDPTNGVRVGIEVQTDGATTKLTPFAGGVPSGVEREWYRNGQLRSESTYRAGVRDGIQKEWDQKGRLVGLNRLNRGEGIIRIFQSNGRIKSESNYSNGLLNGSSIEVTLDGRVDIENYKDGNCIGYSFQFHANDAIQYIFNHGAGGGLIGENVVFDKNGDILRVFYRVNDVQLSKDEYLECRKTNKALPAVEMNVNDYKNLITKYLLDDLERIRKFKAVSIPLNDAD
jgi:antitoxin component YwqK of YwqJK toxin-antitoxin module